MNHFGAMTGLDSDLLIEILSTFCGKPHLRFLEIGTHAGGTARGVSSWCADNKIGLEYWGVESGAICNPLHPFEGANMVFGDSIKVSHLIRGGIDIAFIDGDHGGNHVILDTLLYGEKVKLTGYMLFHDTSPEIQQTMPEAEGPPIPWFHNSVNKAHQLMGFPNNEWVLIKGVYEPGAKIGGMTAYQRIVWHEPIA